MRLSEPPFTRGVGGIDRGMQWFPKCLDMPVVNFREYSLPFSKRPAAIRKPVLVLEKGLGRDLRRPLVGHSREIRVGFRPIADCDRAVFT